MARWQCPYNYEEYETRRRSTRGRFGRMRGFRRSAVAGSESATAADRSTLQGRRERGDSISCHFRLRSGERTNPRLFRDAGRNHTMHAAGSGTELLLVLRPVRRTRRHEYEDGVL